MCKAERFRQDTGQDYISKRDERNKKGLPLRLVASRFSGVRMELVIPGCFVGEQPF